MSATSRISIGGGVELEVFHHDRRAGAPAPVCAAHPCEAFGPETAQLLASTGGAPVVCVNPAGLGGSTGELRPTLEEIADDIERVRRELGVGRWVFWGMSGGGFLALLHARRHPDALAGIVVESACLCFRARLADPACVLSPHHPAWRTELAAAGLLSEGSHAGPADDGETEWLELPRVGAVLRRSGGPALLVSPVPLSPSFRRMMPALLRFDARPWIHALRVPALILAGTADPVAPLARVRAIHEALAGSSFLAVDGAGHVPTAERRPEVHDAVRSFLAGLAPPSGPAVEARRRGS